MTGKMKEEWAKLLFELKTKALAMARIPAARQFFLEFFQQNWKAVPIDFSESKQSITVVLSNSTEGGKIQVPLQQFCRTMSLTCYLQSAPDDVFQRLHEFFIREVEAEETNEFLLSQKLNWTDKAPPVTGAISGVHFIGLAASQEEKLCERVANAMDERKLDPAKCQIVQYFVPSSIRGTETKIHGYFHAVIYYRP